MALSISQCELLRGAWPRDACSWASRDIPFNELSNSQVLVRRVVAHASCGMMLGASAWCREAKNRFVIPCREIMIYITKP